MSSALSLRLQPTDSLVSEIFLLQAEIFDELLSCACMHDCVGRRRPALFGHALRFVVVALGS